MKQITAWKNIHSSRLHLQLPSSEKDPTKRTSTSIFCRTFQHVISTKIEEWRNETGTSKRANSNTPGKPISPQSVERPSQIAQHKMESRYCTPGDETFGSLSPTSLSTIRVDVLALHNATRRTRRGQPARSELTQRFIQQQILGGKDES